MRSQPDEIMTSFVLNKSVSVKLTYFKDAVFLYVSDVGDKEDKEKCVILEADQVDLFISALNFYKGRLRKGCEIDDD